jgi:hypothetical protein
MLNTILNLFNGTNDSVANQQTIYTQQPNTTIYFHSSFLYCLTNNVKSSKPDTVIFNTTMNLFSGRNQVSLNKHCYALQAVDMI